LLHLFVPDRPSFTSFDSGQNSLLQILDGAIVRQTLLRTAVEARLDIECVLAVTVVSIRTERVRQTKDLHCEVAEICLYKANISQSRLSAQLRILRHLLHGLEDGLYCLFWVRLHGIAWVW